MGRSRKTLDEESDDALMLRTAEGSAEALAVLFDRWKLRILSFLHRSLGSLEDAEDLTLEVFVRLHGAAPGYEASGRFPAFIFQTARHLMLNELRRRNRKPAMPVAPDCLVQLAGAERREDQSEELEEIFRKALQTLPERYRTPLLLLHQQELDYDEMAEALGLSQNALRVNLFRGRRKLRKAMEDLQ